MGAWYKDKKRMSYVVTYKNEKDMRKEVQEASKHGWMPQSTAATGSHINVGRTVTGAALTGGFSLLFGASRSKAVLTIAYIRRPEPVHVEQTVIVQQQAPQVVSAPLSGDLADQLDRLADLRDREVLSEGEFRRAKQRLLASNATRPQMRIRSRPAALPPPAGLPLVEAARRLGVASTTLEQWISRARAENGGTVAAQRGFPGLVIKVVNGQTYVSFR